MKLPESATGMAEAFTWKTYSVSRGAKQPLLRFIVEALELRGCHVLHTSEPSLAPFYIVFETPTGDRWPAPGSEDTELGVLMELEVDHGETEVYAGVQT